MKKIAIISLVLVFVGIASQLQAEKLGTLENLLMPQMMVISHDQVYCLQETTVFMYKLEDLKFLKQFCKRGEGPGELKINPGITNYIIPLADSLMVVGMDKAINYTTEGVLKEEFRIPPMSANYMYPLGDDTYLGLKFSPPAPNSKPQLVAGIMDKKMEIKTELYKQDFSGGQNLINLTTDGINIAVDNEKIYIEESSKGFVVSIFDFKGKLISRISKEMAPVKFTKEHEENALNRLKQNPALKAMGWENFKNAVKIIHDDYLPLIQDLQVDQGLIYLMGTDFKEGKLEFKVIDQKGKIVKTVFLPEPLPTDFVSVIFGRPTCYYSIYEGKYYYLKENLDEETWELHMENI